MVDWVGLLLSTKTVENLLLLFYVCICQPMFKLLKSLSTVLYEQISFIYFQYTIHTRHTAHATKRRYLVQRRHYTIPTYQTAKIQPSEILKTSRYDRNAHKPIRRIYLLVALS